MARHATYMQRCCFVVSEARYVFFIIAVVDRARLLIAGALQRSKAVSTDAGPQRAMQKKLLAIWFVVRRGGVSVTRQAPRRDRRA